MSNDDLSELFRVLLDALCCVMAADGKVSKHERQTIAMIFDKLNAPLTSAEVEVEMDQFIQHVNTSGLRDVLDRTNADLASRFNQSKHQRTFLKALHMVAKADGDVGDKDLYVVKCLTEALESSLDPPGASEGVLAANLPSPCPLCGAMCEPGATVCANCAGKTAKAARPVQTSLQDKAYDNCNGCGLAIRFTEWRKIWVYRSNYNGYGDGDYHEDGEVCPHCGARKPYKPRPGRTGPRRGLLETLKDWFALSDD